MTEHDAAWNRAVNRVASPRAQFRVHLEVDNFRRDLCLLEEVLAEELKNAGIEDQFDPQRARTWAENCYQYVLSMLPKTLAGQTPAQDSRNPGVPNSIQSYPPEPPDNP